MDEALGDAAAAARFLARLPGFLRHRLTLAEARTTLEGLGCRLEQLGWRTHLHSIRSYEKLTAGGLTFLDTDVIRVLEETLPRRFGGNPTDYQLLEDEAEDGQPRLRLLVDPAVGVVDTEAVATVFFAGVGGGVELWRQAGFLSVERRRPLSTSSGKICRPPGASPRGSAGRRRRRPPVTEA